MHAFSNRLGSRDIDGRVSSFENIEVVAEETGKSSRELAPSGVGGAAALRSLEKTDQGLEPIFEK